MEIPAFMAGFVVATVIWCLVFGRANRRATEKLHRQVWNLEDDLAQSARREVLSRNDAAQVRSVLDKATKAGLIMPTEGRLGPPPERRAKMIPVHAYGSTPAKPEGRARRLDDTPNSDPYLTTAAVIAATGMASTPAPAAAPDPAPSSGGSDFSTGGSVSSGGFETGGSI